MSLVELVPLLRRIRDDLATPEECARARALVGQDDRLPQEVRRDALVDDLRADAVGLLAVLGEEETFGADLLAAIEGEAGRVDLPLDDEWTPMQAALRAELAAEAGGVDLAGAVLGAVGLAEPELPVADAVRDEAGTVDVTGAIDLFLEGSWISGFLDNELDPATHRLAARALAEEGAGARMTDLADLGHALREAAHEEAGEIDVWAGVAKAIGVEDPEAIPGWDGALLAEAVRDEAGTVDVTKAVMERVRRLAMVPGGTSVPRPANRSLYRWLSVAAGLAAAILLVILAGHDLSGPRAKAFDVHFASPDEISITDLSYADNTDVQVIQDEGKDAPLIIWVDDSQEAKK